MPEESHLLFERAPGICHSGEPPAQELASVKLRKVEGVRKVKTAAKQILHLAIVTLLIIEEEVDRALTPARGNIIDFRWTSSEAHPSHKMSGVVIRNRCHLYHSRI